MVCALPCRKRVGAMRQCTAAHWAYSVVGGRRYGEDMITEFALARGDLDSAADDRTRVSSVEVLREGPAKVVFAKYPGSFLVEQVEGKTHLLTRSSGAGLDSAWVDSVPASSLWFLGRDLGGTAWVVHSVSEAERAVGRPAVPGGSREWRELTQFAYDLEEPTESLVATQASALLAWHEQARFCQSCGGLMQIASAGWTRECGVCGSTDYPRTDPAIIVAVTDPIDRLLLVHNAAWRGRRMSLLAGYVDAGESAERTVRREVHEEVGLDVGGLEYLGSQPWPKPRSLMLVYRARTARVADPIPDGVEIDRARFFTRSQLRAALAQGDVVLPGPSAVAYAVIRQWLEGEL